MKKTCVFFINNQNTCILRSNFFWITLQFSWTLSAMKLLKFGFFSPCFSSIFTSEDNKAFRISIFKLHVTNGNSHHMTICHVKNMTSHCSPFLNTFDVIKHDPCILEVPIGLHSPHQINNICKAICWHFLKIHYRQTLAHEHILLDIIIPAFFF